MAASGQTCPLAGQTPPAPAASQEESHHRPLTPAVPEHIVCDDVHQLQLGPDEEDDVLDVRLRQAPRLEREHLFHLMFLRGGEGVSKPRGPPVIRPGSRGTATPPAPPPPLPSGASTARSARRARSGTRPTRSPAGRERGVSQSVSRSVGPPAAALTLEPAHLSRNSRSSRRPASRSAVRLTRPELRCAAMTLPPPPAPLT